MEDYDDIPDFLKGYEEKKTNVIRFPSYRRKKQIDMDRGNIHCVMSERSITVRDAMFSNGVAYTTMDVMTIGASGKERKLCEIVIDMNELVDVVKRMIRE